MIAFFALLGADLQLYSSDWSGFTTTHQDSVYVQTCPAAVPEAIGGFAAPFDIPDFSLVASTFSGSDFIASFSELSTKAQASVVAVCTSSLGCAREQWGSSALTSTPGSKTVHADCPLGTFALSGKVEILGESKDVGISRSGASGLLLPRRWSATATALTPQHDPWGLSVTALCVSTDAGAYTTFKSMTPVRWMGAPAPYYFLEGWWQALGPTSVPVSYSFVLPNSNWFAMRTVAHEPWAGASGLWA